MPHGKYMRGTRLDYIIVSGLVFLLALIIAFAVNPAKSLAYARDERRGDDVRKIMSAVLQMPIDHPEKYEALLNRVEGREGERFMLGNGSSCSGDWGEYCSDELVPDDCLPLEEIFSSEETAVLDPETTKFGTFASGYYLSFSEGMVRAGACDPDTRPLFLESLVR